MSDNKTGKVSGAGASAPNKMRLYATWVDRTPPNCIPRLCSLTLTRLVVLRPLGSDLASISIAVKMQSSKRTLRSNELNLPQGGLLDTPLDVTFCLQYPHFLKREGNKLHILLQRRKRYKNRTMLGFKTLAEGIIRMDQVLQKQMDMELEMVPDGGAKDKEKGPIARLSLLQLQSTPVDQEHKTDREHDFSDDDEEISSGEEEVADLSDSGENNNMRNKLPQHHNTRHNNLKQRFVSLLKRFRVPDSEVARAGDLSNPSDIQALFQELESLSCDDDSGGDQEDTMSISSTPKPSLRPFFSSSKSLIDSTANQQQNQQQQGHPNNQITFNYSNDGTDRLLFYDENHHRTCSLGGSDGYNAGDIFTDPEGYSDPQTGSPPREQNVCSTPRTKQQTSETSNSNNEFSNLMQEISERKSKLFRSSASSAKKKNSLSVSSDAPAPETLTARKIFLEQVSRLLPIEETALPEAVLLVMGSDSIISPLISRLSHHRIFQPLSGVEVRAVLTAVFNKIHKYCNSCAKPGTFVKLVLIGGDTLIGWTIRPYVELLSSKPPEWMNYTRIYIVPLGQCGITKHLANLDQGYSTMFPTDQELKIDELATRLQRYLSVPSSAPIAQLPLGEAMLTCQDDSSQLFIPFVNEVRVGPADQSLSVSVDLDDLMCTSPPAPSLTPPSSPNVQSRDSPWEPLELQLDYWQLMSKCTDQTTVKTDKTKQDGKTSLKGLFRGLQAQPSNSNGLNLTIHMANKEKKQKIMRLGKKKEKEKDVEPRSQNVEGISRLICSARSFHNAPMRVYIDGVEFNGVKFFQLSSTWQTHVKSLSVALAGVPLASSEVNSM